MSNWSDHSIWMSDRGFEDGWTAAMNTVSNVTRELLEAGQTDLADQVHRLVWRRLMERHDVVLAERKAKRDQYAAEIAARKAS